MLLGRLMMDIFVLPWWLCLAGLQRFSCCRFVVYSWYIYVNIRETSPLIAPGFLFFFGQRLYKTAIGFQLRQGLPLLNCVLLPMQIKMLEWWMNEISQHKWNTKSLQNSLMRTAEFCDLLTHLWWHLPLFNDRVPSIVEVELSGYNWMQY